MPVPRDLPPRREYGARHLNCLLDLGHLGALGPLRKPLSQEPASPLRRQPGFYLPLPPQCFVGNALLGLLRAWQKGRAMTALEPARPVAKADQTVFVPRHLLAGVEHAQPRPCLSVLLSSLGRLKWACMPWRPLAMSKTAPATSCAIQRPRTLWIRRVTCPGGVCDRGPWSP